MNSIDVWVVNYSVDEPTGVYLCFKDMDRLWVGVITRCEIADPDRHYVRL